MKAQYYVHTVVIDNVEPVSKHGSIKLVFTINQKINDHTTVTKMVYDGDGHSVDVYFTNSSNKKTYITTYFRIISITFETEPQ